MFGVAIWYQIGYYQYDKVPNIPSTCTLKNRTPSRRSGTRCVQPELSMSWKQIQYLTKVTPVCKGACMCGKYALTDLSLQKSPWVKNSRSELWHIQCCSMLLLHSKQLSFYLSTTVISSWVRSLFLYIPPSKSFLVTAYVKWEEVEHTCSVETELTALLSLFWKLVWQFRWI